jgi:hypothetical protein
MRKTFLGSNCGLGQRRAGAALLSMLTDPKRLGGLGLDFETWDTATMDVPFV